MPTKLLLTEDIEDLGRSGDVVTVKPGYARNYLIPKGKGVLANKRALRIQARLQEERQKKAIEDKKEAEALAKKLDGATLTKTAKVDEEGHMYGSVSALDVIHLVEEELKVILEKKSMPLKQPIKKVGVYPIQVKLKEGVSCSITLKVISDEVIETTLATDAAPAEEKEAE